MATAKEKMQQAAEKIASNTAMAKQIGAVYKFVLEGDGGGTWIMDLRDDPKIVEGDGEAQCTILMAAGDYVDMMEGRAQGQQLFFMGKLRIEGDMGLAMKLQSLTELLS
jgi:putative sterol carrier protein